MRAEQSNRRLIWILATALFGALLAIAFLLGRETGREPSRAVGLEPVAPPVPEPIGVDAPAPSQRGRWDVEPTRDPSSYQYPKPTRDTTGWIEERPDGTIVISNARPGDTPSSAVREVRTPTGTPMPAPVPAAAPAAEPPSARNAGNEVAAYFEKVSLIRSEAGAGDPNSFAMSLIKGGLGGSTAGFDRLVEDSERMERELRAIAPPPECQAFHEANLETMAESREMLKEMRDAIVKRDIQKLNQIAQDAADLQGRAEALSRMQEELLKSAASR